MQPQHQCVSVCVCVNVRIANDFSYHSSFFEFSFFLFLFVFSTHTYTYCICTYFCQTVTILGYTSTTLFMFARCWIPLSVFVSNDVQARQKKVFSGYVGIVLYVLPPAIAGLTIIWVHKCTHMYSMYRCMCVCINQREFSRINVSLSADVECVCACRVACGRQWQS